MADQTRIPSQTPNAEQIFVWTPQLSHGLLQLCNDQNDKGHWKGTCLDEIGRQSVRAEFLKLFGLDLPWKIFKHRMDHLKKQYDVYKRITRNATGLGFNEAGEINMESDWWNELIKGRFEILSLSGSFMPTENGGTEGRSGGMSISLVGPNGKIVGGGLAGMLIAASPVQVIMGSFIVMHQAEQTQKKKPRIMEASSPPPQPPQQQLPIFTITTVNTTSPEVSTVEEPKKQTYGGGDGTMRPLSCLKCFLLSRTTIQL